MNDTSRRTFLTDRRRERGNKRKVWQMSRVEKKKKKLQKETGLISQVNMGQSEKGEKQWGGGGHPAHTTVQVGLLLELYLKHN